MNDAPSKSIWYFYVFVAVTVSFFVALNLEKRFKERNPSARPYVWGFYVGCTGLACVPIALLTFLAMLNSKDEASGEFLAYTLFFTLQAITGWLTIKRKRWAFIVGTILSFNPISYIINYAYIRNRWNEFAVESFGVPDNKNQGNQAKHFNVEKSPQQGEESSKQLVANNNDLDVTGGQSNRDVTPPNTKVKRDLPFSNLVSGKENSWVWLTCKADMGKGPRRLLLVISVPFFLYFVIPGIIFWLFVRLVLWIVNGFREDKKPKDATKLEKSTETV